MKLFFLEISRAYTYQTVVGLYGALRKAQSIIQGTPTLGSSPVMEDFMKLLKKKYGERISGTAESLKNIRRPLLPMNIYKIIDNTPLSAVGIRVLF